jgi:hypothetical protein
MRLDIKLRYDHLCPQSPLALNSILTILKLTYRNQTPGIYT